MGTVARRAVFLDRDGVINRNVLNPASGNYEAPLTVRQFALLPGVPQALERLQRADYLLFLVSNQPNTAKGKSSLAKHHAIHRKMQRQLTRAQVKFAATYYCLHHPDGCVAGFSGPCACRKPSPYFLLRARREFGLDLKHSWMIGDRSTDILCGRNAGVKTIFVSSNGDASTEAASGGIVASLAEAAEIICAPANG